MNQISKWVLTIMAKFGYFSIIFAMFAENIFPPTPSEVIMPAPGFAVARGDLLLVILAGTLGCVLGALPLYYLGNLLNEERLVTFTKKYGKFVFFSIDCYRFQQLDNPINPCRLPFWRKLRRYRNHACASLQYFLDNRYGHHH